MSLNWRILEPYWSLPSIEQVVYRGTRSPTRSPDHEKIFYRKIFYREIIDEEIKNNDICPITLCSIDLNFLYAKCENPITSHFLEYGEYLIYSRDNIFPSCPICRSYKIPKQKYRNINIEKVNKDKDYQKLMIILLYLKYSLPSRRGILFKEEKEEEMEEKKIKILRTLGHEGIYPFYFEKNILTERLFRWSLQKIITGNIIFCKKLTSIFGLMSIIRKKFGIITHREDELRKETSKFINHSYPYLKYIPFYDPKDDIDFLILDSDSEFRICEISSKNFRHFLPLKEEDILRNLFNLQKHKMLILSATPMKKMTMEELRDILELLSPDNF